MHCCTAATWVLLQTAVPQVETLKPLLNGASLPLQEQACHVGPFLDSSLPMDATWGLFPIYVGVNHTWPEWSKKSYFNALYLRLL